MIDMILKIIPIMISNYDEKNIVLRSIISEIIPINHTYLRSKIGEIISRNHTFLRSKIGEIIPINHTYLRSKIGEIISRNHTFLRSKIGEIIPKNHTYLRFYCPCAKLYAFFSPHTFRSSVEHILKSSDKL